MASDTVVPVRKVHRSTWLITGLACGFLLELLFANSPDRATASLHAWASIITGQPVPLPQCVEPPTPVPAPTPPAK